MGLKHFSLGLLLGIVLIGCAGFSYRYYGLDLPSYDGTLLGPEPKDDIDFKRCMPDDFDKNKCVVMLHEDAMRLKQDYLDTKDKLKACEKSTKSITILEKR